MKANGIFCVKLQIQGREAFRLLKRATLETYGDDVVFISDELVIAVVPSDVIVLSPKTLLK